MISAGGKASIVLATDHSFGWYDFTVKSAAHPNFLRRYAGHVETDKWAYTDPVMGGVID